MNLPLPPADFIFMFILPYLTPYIIPGHGTHFHGLPLTPWPMIPQESPPARPTRPTLDLHFHHHFTVATVMGLLGSAHPQQGSFSALRWFRPSLALT